MRTGGAYDAVADPYDGPGIRDAPKQGFSDPSSRPALIDLVAARTSRSRELGDDAVRADDGRRAQGAPVLAAVQDRDKV
jgi:hypothetical protein